MMHIKDSSFYEEIRDTTEAKLYLIRPSYKSFDLTVDVGTGFSIGDDVSWSSESTMTIPSGIFERGISKRNPPLLYSSCNEELEFTLTATTDDFIKSSLPIVSTGERELYIMIVYAVDENGVVLAPPGVERVTLISTNSTPAGTIVQPGIIIPASETGFSIESMHLCYVVPVDPTDISDISHKDKNDIILSSIPYRNLEIELFDEGGRYSEFVKTAGKKLRVLLQYQYNDTHSNSFIYYYDQDPTHDKSTALPKTRVKLGGLMDVLSSASYVNTSSMYTSVFDKEVNTYLKEIADSFRTNLIPSETYNTVYETPYGGDFLKLMLYAGYGKRGVIEGEELIMEEYLHRTCTPADGYTFSDAIRLLVNAQCHLMRVENERISVGAPQYILRDSGIVFTEDEYYSVPKRETFKDVDQIKVSAESWGVGEKRESHLFRFAFKDGGEQFYIADKAWVATRFEYGKPLVDIEKEWHSGDPFFVLGDCASVTASGAFSALWNEAAHRTRGYASVTITGTPLEKNSEASYSKNFGSGKEVLELRNPFLRPRDSGYSYDIPDEYIDFNYEYQSGKTIFTLETRGRFDVHPLDIIQFIDDNGDLRSGIVIEHDMKYNGAMRSTFRVVDDGSAPNLYASETAICSRTLLCREEE